MITLLAFLYIFNAIAYFYTYKAGYSLLRYMWKEKNINVYLGTEIIFLIITSLIVFTNQPLNWIIAILMFLHLIGIVWLVGNPGSFYRIAEESINLDQATIENGVVLMFLIYAGLTLFSRMVF